MRDPQPYSATRALLRAPLLAALALSGSPAFAQTYPARPIRLLLPFAGGTDAVARVWAAKLSPALGAQILPEQHLGAGGNIAHEAVARAAPDGYTLLMGAPPLVINPLLNPRAGFDPLRDFAPIALLTAMPNVLVVHPKVAAKTLDELVQLARSDPGKLTYGSGGVGSVPHPAAGLPKLVVVNWYALLAPAGTPRAIVERLNAESVKAMNAPDTRERLAGLGGEPLSATPEQTAALLKAEYEQWGKVIREAGIKAE